MTMKIHLPILRLCAAILNQDPLNLLTSWSFQTKDKMNEALLCLKSLKGVMPDPLLQQVAAFLGELANHRGGPIEFIYLNEPLTSEQEAISRWIHLLRGNA